MSEFDELFGDEFFVFDSENLDSVTEKFYGYMVTEKGIVQNENLNPNVELTGIGAYLWV